MKIHVRLSEPGSLVMRVQADGMPLRVAEIQLPKWKEEYLILSWLMSVFRDYLDYLPADIEFEIGEVVADKYKKDIQQFINYIDNTSALMEQVKPTHGTKLLFVNVSDDLRYGSFYSVLNEQVPTLYLDLDLGFNRQKREWSAKDRKPFPDLKEFLKYLIDNRVGTVITVNYYLLDRFRYDTGVLLNPLLKRMGIRLVKIENDPDDLRTNGYIMRTAYYEHSWPAFSNLYCLTKWWDARNGNCNITHIAIPQDYRGTTKNLRDDYRIVVLSNSRWGSVQAIKQLIDPLFASMENPWRDLTTWYMAMRRMILNGDLTEHDRLFANSRLHQFFWMAAQDLKYQAIKALKTDRPIDVYGDEGWKNVCPELYRGSLDNRQIEELFQRDDILILLANCSFTYQDASGPVYDMIRRGAHWVNLPVVAKTEPLRGLAEIEYSTPDELNALVNDVKPAFKKAKQSLHYYRRLLKSSVNELIETIKGNQVRSMWNKELMLHEQELATVIDEYTVQNEVFLRAAFRVIRQ